MGKSISLVNITRMEECDVMGRDHDWVTMYLLFLLRHGMWQVTDEIFSTDDYEDYWPDKYAAVSEADLKTLGVYTIDFGKNE